MKEEKFIGLRKLL